MDVSEPRVRRRGLFLTTHDVDTDSAEHLDHEAAEGVSIRVRIIRRRIRVHSSSLSTPSRRPGQALKSASAIDTRRRSRSRR